MKKRSGLLAALGSLFSTLTTSAAYPVILSALTVKSEWTRLQASRHPDRIHWERDYAGQPIVLLALFQKGRLRPDTVRLLKAAKAAGLYVLAVNTLKLDPASQAEGLIDCYIERFNFGRDFGSYKCGFAHVARRGWDATCPRLLMVNDSVFFTEERMPRFLAEMLGPGPEVLGSTENFELNHHLGSFCIAMDGRILRHAKFRRYWRRYRMTDVRPVVIHKGEMGLSKALRKCVSAQGEFRALFGADRFLKALQEDETFLDRAIRDARGSMQRQWRRLSFRTVLDKLKDRNLVETFDPGDAGFDIEAPVANVSERMFINSFAEFQDFVRHNLAPGATLDPEVLRLTLVEHMVEVFMSHSQIHQNAIVLLRMGLPIVKLDGIYRGMFGVLDVERISQLLGAEEAQELRRLLLERPDGAETLQGWRRAAFMRGLI